jgi:RecB family exonuclease
MQQYIHQVVYEIIKANNNFTNTSIILPNKRASIFVKNEIKSQISLNHFLPKIKSIEEFVFDISKINKTDNLVLLFEFYKIYLENTEKEKIEAFDEFSNWASILIKDFNEIDSYLINSNQLFKYLKDINRIENWFNNKQDQTTLSKKYLQFFEKIEIYYTKYYNHLKNHEIGYQGLQYREANEKIEQFIKNNTNKKFIFIGFNALNKSENNIIKALLANNLADIYFDLDHFLLKENISANRFINTYKTKWNYFNHHKFNFITNEFEKEKEIKIIGIPKNVSQIKYASEIIKSTFTNKNLALILANEELLTTTINSLPKNIENINITMGLPLKNIQYASLFSLIFRLHKNKEKLGNKQHFYHKDIIALLNHPNFIGIIDLSLENLIKSDNLIFINKEQIQTLNTKNLTKEIFKIIFSNWSNSNLIIDKCLALIEILKNNTQNQFEIEYINRFNQIFNQIKVLNKTYGYIKTLDGFINIYQQVLNNETLSFKGDATHGLQIMGMLETRVLEFETLIIASVNEGFIPAGKSNNSFIPFDVKLQYGLPTYQEKDAIFSYHFFRLIARAKKVYLIYNTETDDFGSGEQSRFISQLELLKEKLPNLKLTKTVVSPIIDHKQDDLKKIVKNQSIIDVLYKANNNGFAPSTLTNYIYNPISFYKQKIMRLNQVDEIEEHIAANTFGNVVHKVLENFYKPFKGQFLKVDDILQMKKNIDLETEKIFKEKFINGDITNGKNLLAFEVSKQFVKNFLNQEIQLLKQNKQLKIIDLEVNLNTSIMIEGIDLPINLRGQADRIDILDGVIRIIDYKTGVVKQTQLNIKDWEKLITDYKFSKAFQVLMYAYMYAKMNKISFDDTSLESGIISFKNLRAGFMKVNKKQISNKDITEFEIQLKQLLSEIFNKEIDFIENENLPY